MFTRKENFNTYPQHDNRENDPDNLKEFSYLASNAKRLKKVFPELSREKTVELSMQWQIRYWLLSLNKEISTIADVLSNLDIKAKESGNE